MGGNTRRDTRNLMCDAGLAGPFAELLFPSVLLATALVLLFNAVVVFLSRVYCFSSSLSDTLFYILIFFIVGIFITFVEPVSISPLFLLLFLVSLLSCLCRGNRAGSSWRMSRWKSCR
ncbi:hypothetical protein F4809DRAFT_587857 [Biscogniauxia mediterranea]|nr:hypothetical protein F4809DRAFT_587857 [Biscogniauxia mediterranea]